MASKTLIIDGNARGYFHHGSGRVLKSGDYQTQSVFGFVREMRELREYYPDFTPVVLWDGRAEWRYALHPDYKSNREKDPKQAASRAEYKKVRHFINDALEHLGVRQMTVMTHEADDMAGYMVQQLSADPANEIILHTGDKDWLQLVRPNVIWGDIRRDRESAVRFAKFFDLTGYKTPIAFLEGKCLQGDTSDVISGVGKIGEGTAPLILAEFGSVRHFWRGVDDGSIKPRDFRQRHLATPEARRLFIRNFQLMQLQRVAKPAKEDVRLVAGALNEEKFAAVCEELAFRSILTTLEEFTRPFRSK
ncbi:5'-3' exonuclease [Cupriavidus campinensis]|uniref:5'-3' exonuclease n=1 Tax=Cupriavidus campinensis TaxID=151783 RepID=A0ABY3ETD9_9BURK|nr:5'-3' exonuclease [Cupriavidus campinensis]TSP13998.1 5'-3' exonuclease [Cupriavidus campinensis]